MKAVANDLPAGPVAALVEAPLAFHRTLPGYEPTPLVEAPALAARLGIAALSIKDESARLGLPAFKILGASWATACLISHETGCDVLSGLDRLGAAARAGGIRRLVAASEGNHGRAVARTARWLGLESRIVLPAHAESARVAAIRGEGADVQTVAGAYDDAVRAARETAAEEGSRLIADVAHGPGDGAALAVVDGYGTLFRELDDELASPPTLVLLQIGVGSFAAAGARYARALDPPASVVGVESTAAACAAASLAAGRPVAITTGETTMAGLNAGTLSTAAWPVLAATLAGVVCVDDHEAAAAMEQLAVVGVAAGPCGAAALAGLAAVAGDPACARLRRRAGVAASTRALIVVTEAPPAG